MVLVLALINQGLVMAGKKYVTIFRRRDDSVHLFLFLRQQLH
nr:hypothetical protein [Streptococcus uberis]